MNNSLRAGLTQPHPCSYLEQQVAQEIVLLIDEETLKYAPHEGYSPFAKLGFRRAGSQIYRPHCPECQRCQSLRINTKQFMPSRSQKRILNKNRLWTIKWHDAPTHQQFALYQHYQNTRHPSGPMSHDQWQDYLDMTSTPWQKTRFLHLYDHDQLIAVAITDWFEDGLSAVYSFFDCGYASYSLGYFLILQQIKQAQLEEKAWVYLGFQIDDCQKMNYKSRFTPHQRFIASQWRAEKSE